MTEAKVTSAKEQFDRQAAQYNSQWAGWSDETLKRMLELADPQSSWQVLDVATGTGFTALAFAALVAQVVGVDLSPGMLAQAANRAKEQGAANISWVEAPAEKLPFPNRHVRSGDSSYRAASFYRRAGVSVGDTSGSESPAAFLFWAIRPFRTTIPKPLTGRIRWNESVTRPMRRI